MGRVPKKQSFASFADSDVCWDLEHLPKSLDEVFDNDKSLLVELGAGTCYFSTGFAEIHSDWNVIATDFKRDRLWKGAKRANKAKLDNMAFINIDVAKLAQIFPEQSVDQLWLTFPDPHPKTQHQKRRTNQPDFLATYKKLLKPDGSFNLKTDDRNFFIETIKNIEKAGWVLDKLATDLHQNISDGDETIQTRYEQEFIQAGVPINFLSASKLL